MLLRHCHDKKKRPVAYAIHAELLLTPRYGYGATRHSARISVIARGVMLFFEAAATSLLMLPLLLMRAAMRMLRATRWRHGMAAMFTLRASRFCRLMLPLYAALMPCCCYAITIRLRHTLRLLFCHALMLPYC